MRLRARVRGLVQGVGFRYSTVREAERIGGITGYVRNAHDGSVVVVAEGQVDRLRRLERWLGEGPAGAVVSSLETGYAPASLEWSSFGVEY